MALETFDYADGTTSIPNTTVWGNGGFFIDNGSLKADNNSSLNVIVWPSSPDGGWSGNFIENNTSSANYGVVFRGVDANNYWVASLNYAGRLRLTLVENGSTSTLHDANIADTSSPVILVDASGDTINITVDGNLVHTETSSVHQNGTYAGLRVDSTNHEVTEFSYTDPAGAASSILKIRNNNDLPVSEAVQVYVHKVADKTVMFEGVISFTNGDADIPLPLAEFPVGTTVDWSMIDPANEMASSARQDTE